jgi:hypothetical protein
MPVARKGVRVVEWESCELNPPTVGHLSPTGRVPAFGMPLYSRFNCGAGTKGDSSTWPEMAA